MFWHQATCFGNIVCIIRSNDVLLRYEIILYQGVACVVLGISWVLVLVDRREKTSTWYQMLASKVGTTYYYSATRAQRAPQRYRYNQDFQQSVDRKGMSAKPPRGQLNRENEYLPVLVRA